MEARLRDGRAQALIRPDRDDFVRRHTRLGPVPFVPEIRLHQAEEATSLWHMTEDDLGRAGLPPPFWAFAWAGGRGLARHVLDHPELVAGKRVLDFASGSGLVAIAAALAGAGRVQAVDVDPFAFASIGLNAVANGVAVEAFEADWIGRGAAADVVLAGDIFYDRAFSARVLPWLRVVAGQALVLVGDPARAYRPADGVIERARYDVPVERALEDGTIKSVTILEWLRGGDAGPGPACDRASNP